MRSLCQQKHSQNACIDLTCTRIKFVFSRQLLPKLNKLHCVNGSVSAVFCMRYSGIYKGSWIINFKGKLASSKADLGGSYIYILRRETAFGFRSFFGWFMLTSVSSRLCFSANLSSFSHVFAPKSLNHTQHIVGCNQVILPSLHSPGPKNLME